MSAFEPGRLVPCTAYHAATPRGVGEALVRPIPPAVVSANASTTSAETVSFTPPARANGAVSRRGFRSNAGLDLFAEAPINSPRAKATVLFFPD